MAKINKLRLCCKHFGGLLGGSLLFACCSGCDAGRERDGEGAGRTAVGVNGVSVGE
ncbi:hypothetical protein [Bacteroides pyogenes]|uniref:hypothetical protein n=1 Tax=Bacteroides pyogenes TaxID=310300 RepID=UPI0016531B58|nr:hypothetical protein [Bacteroides pyogenes]